MIWWSVRYWVILRCRATWRRLGKEHYAKPMDCDKYYMNITIESISCT
jgi:hypothetical protein